MVLQDKIVLITGADNDLGNALALLMANRGAKLALVARSSEELELLAAQCQHYSTESMAFALDDNTPQAIESLVKQILDKFGKVDILINNNGIGSWGILIEQSPEEICKTIQINLTNTILLTRALLPNLVKNKDGAQIVNMCSIAAKIPLHMMAVYTATKFGLYGFAEALRRELEDTQIDIINVISSPVDSNYFEGENAVGRKQAEVIDIGAPEEVAEGIFDAINRRSREVVIGSFNKFTLFASKIAPGLSNSLVKQVFSKTRHN
ncbi:MAG: SDR family NAD(P)-dependent oxidoreductase [Bacteroidia bacterium]|nr:SDR family NAD(P)-dependent oxidoreductase [Bacteroidia bacterium]MDW8348357.1 SDR family NAD(P)-dependent oxidoreductase [Bacteroidia bacterium]